MDKPTEEGTYTYQVHKASMLVQGYTALEGLFFTIQLLDEN